MPAIACKCGERLRYGDIPNPIEWLMISDTDYDNYHDEIDAENLYREMKSILQCPKCERLWIFWNGLDSDPISYCRE